MMKEKFLNDLDIIIKKYEFEDIPEMNSLKSSKLEIFLCGLPSSGKTTFLNAVLGLSRNELFESTKKATKCIFKISHGDSYCYSTNGKDIEKMPADLNSRKDLLKYLNETNSFIELFIPSDFLEKVNVYDAPGLFSGDSSDKNYEYILRASELILLLKNSEDMFEPKELSLTNDVNKNGANYIILFSFSDLFEMDPKEQAKYFEEKTKEFRSAIQTFNISSEEFFVNPSKGKIQDVKSYIDEKIDYLKEHSNKEKAKICGDFYINLLQTKLNENEKYIGKEVNKLEDLFNVEFTRQGLDIRDKKREVSSLLSNSIDKMITEIKKKLENKNKTQGDLNSIWTSRIEDFITKINNLVEDDLIIPVPPIPECPDLILNSNYDFDDIGSKLRSLLRDKKEDENEKEWDDVINDEFAKKLKDYLNPSEEDSKKVEIQKKENDYLIEILDRIDFLKSLPELYNAVQYFRKLKLYLIECKEILNKELNPFAEKAQTRLDKILSEQKEQISKDLVEQKSILNQKLKIDEIKEDICKLKEYI